MHQCAPRYRQRIAPCGDQSLRPIERRVAVAASQRLAKRGQHVVVHALVHAHCLLLNGLLRRLKVDDDAPVTIGICGQRGEFERVERVAQVSVRRPNKVLERPLFELDVIIPEPSLPVLDRAEQRPFDVVAREPFELEHTAPRHDRPRHVDVRVLCRRADEDDVALLDRGEHTVRLRLVPAVALVQHQVGARAVQFESALCVLDHALRVRDAARHRVELHEVRARRRGDYPRKRGLAAAGRTVKNAAAETVGDDRAAQHAALAHDVLLTDELVQSARTHALGERLVCLLVEIEQTVHASIIKYIRAFVNAKAAFVREDDKRRLCFGDMFLILAVFDRCRLDAAVLVNAPFAIATRRISDCSSPISSTRHFQSQRKSRWYSSPYLQRAFCDCNANYPSAIETPVLSNALFETASLAANALSKSTRKRAALMLCQQAIPRRFSKSPCPNSRRSSATTCRHRHF